MKHFLFKNIFFILLGSILLTSFGISLYCIDEGHNLGGDFSLYINQAIHILNGTIYDLYEINKYSMDNSGEILFGPYLYPNGFPLLLTPLIIIFGKFNFIAFKVYCLLFFVTSLWLFYIMLRKKNTSKTTILVIISTIAFNNFYIIFSDNVLSDFPYIFFSFLSLILFHKKTTIGNGIFLGVIIFYTYFIRDSGIVLIPSLLTYQVYSYYKLKERFSLKSLAPYITFLTLYILNKSFFPNGGENHLAVFESITIDSINHNTNYYISQFVKFLVGEHFSHNNFIYYFITIMASVGFIMSLKKSPYINVFFVGTLIVYILWPITQGMRFLLPIIPIYLYFLFLPLDWLIKLKQNYSIATWALFSFFLFLNFDYNTQKIITHSNTNTNEAYTKDMVGFYTKIQKKTSKTDTIGFYNPRVLTLFTERASIHYPLEKNKETKLAYIITFKYQKVDGFLPIVKNKTFALQKRIIEYANPQ